MNTIKSLKNKSSVGYDGKSTKIIKSAAVVLAPVLKHIINLSFTTGIFPDNLKIAKVIPIYKSGNRADKANYRLISILPVLSNIFEKVLLTRLISFLEKHNIITDEQYEF